MTTDTRPVEDKEMSNPLKNVSIAEAKRLANDTGATRLLILGIDDRGNYAFTTFGRTKAQCKAMQEWAGAQAPFIGMTMDKAGIIGEDTQ